MMIELAPNRKQGLALASPIIAGPGAVGFGHAGADLVALDVFGAIVTSPVTLRLRRGSAQPRLSAIAGGMLLNHGGQNPGWHRALDWYGSAWARSKALIILHLGGPPADMVDVAIRAEGTPGIAGVEVDLDGLDTLAAISTLRARVELPLLVRLPYSGATLAAKVVEAGADALVCIAPPRGTAMALSAGQAIEGEVYGPLVKPLALKTLREAAAMVSVPLVGCGGVHTAEDVNEFLAAGAAAVMVDSVVWVDPGKVNELVSRRVDE